MIYHGDCLEVMATLPDSSVDAVVTDPPYSTPTIAAFGRKAEKHLSDLAIQEFYFRSIRKELERVLKPDAPVFIFCDDIYYAVLVAVFYDWKRINLLVWDKKRIGMGSPFRKRHELIFYANRGSCVGNGTVTHLPTVLEYSITKKHHGAEKPVELCQLLIDELVPENGTVLDPFMGSGSTGVAAVNAGRNFIGIELEPEYIEIAKARIEAAKEAA